MKNNGTRLIARECILFSVLLFLWIILPFAQLALIKLLPLQGRSYFTCTILAFVTMVLSKILSVYPSYWLLTFVMAIGQVVPFMLLDLLIFSIKASLRKNKKPGKYSLFDETTVVSIILFLILMLPFLSGFC